MMMKTAKSVLLLIMLLIPALFSSAQQAEEAPAAEAAGDAAPDVYIDRLFNDYIELEDRLLAAESPDISDRGPILKMLAEARKQGRDDIISRLEMLDFIISSRLTDQKLAAQPELELSLVKEAEQLRAAREAGEAAGRAAADISLISAAVSSAVYLSSTILYESFYSQYTAQQDAGQAAFYLFWWQIFETTSVISGFSTIGLSLTAGILAAVF